MKKILFLGFQMILISQFSFGQHKADSIHVKKLKWQFQVSSGLFADLLFTNIFYSDDTPPVAYSDIKGKRIKLGRMDRLELKYRVREKSAFSLSFQNALFKDIYGTNNDPLEQWKHARRYFKRIQFSASYYKIYSLNKKNEIQGGLGLLVSGDKTTFPFYGMDNGIALIGATPDYYWWDPGLTLNVHYFYKPCKQLSIGATFYTYFLHQIGIEGAALQGSIGINF
jgi:hypothetical protein